MFGPRDQIPTEKAEGARYGYEGGKHYLVLWVKGDCRRYEIDYSSAATIYLGIAPRVVKR